MRYRRTRLAALALALSCSAAGPPREPGPFLAPDLVDLATLSPTIRLDVRYATADNFLGEAVYAQARAFLQRPAAEALSRAASRLEASGYGLVVFDGYRPWSVTKLFWDRTPPSLRDFVADPRRGSRHNRGCAVDVSLYELSTGDEVEMPSGYDDFSERAHPDYAGGTEAARRHRRALRAAMEAEGFEVYAFEWWHFDFRDWRLYPILDLSFDELARGRPD